MLAAAGMAVALVLCGTAQAATPWDTPGPFVSYYWDVNADNSFTYTTVFGNSWQQLDGPILANGAASIAGLGDIGVARAMIQASGTIQPFVWAGWNDHLTIMPADHALLGQVARVSFDLAYGWSAVLDSNASGYAFVDITLIGGQRRQWAAVQENIDHSCAVAGSCGEMFAYGLTGTSIPSFANGVATFTFDMVLGQDYTIVSGMNVGSNGFGGSLSIDATHSLHWGGTASVTVTGAPVAYSIASLSGLDYAQPVPEAPSAALWLIGLLGLGVRRRVCAGARSPLDG